MARHTLRPRLDAGGSVITAQLAVLDWTAEAGATVRTPAGRWRITRAIAGLDDLRALARRLDTYQLWIHPSWSEAHPDVQLGEAHWLALDLGAGDGQVQHCQLAILAGDKSQPRELAETHDGAELLRVLARTAYLTGTYWHGTGGATGRALLRDCLKRAGRVLEPLPDELRHFRPEPDFGWARPPTAAELARRWVYAFDKHNQYLTAAQSVVLGAGAVEFKSEPGFSARVPAYWHVQLAPWPSSASLPDPTRAAAPGRRDDPAELRWLTTPTVEAALSAGIVESIAAAWYWPIHGRYLQTLASLLRSAVEGLAPAVARGDRSAILCRALLKAIYAELLSGYLARNALRDTDDPLYRPDWRDMLKAEARCRLWYSLRPLAQAGLAPIAVARDSIYLASDAPNPTDALAGLLRIGAMPTQWAPKGRVRLDAMREALTDRVTSCRGLVAAYDAARANAG